MKKVHDHFEVASGERISLDFSATTECSVAIRLDSNPVEIRNVSPLETFSFLYSEQSESVLQVEATFIESVEDARCEISLRDGAGVTFSGPTLTPARPRVVIKFTRRGGAR